MVFRLQRTDGNLVRSFKLVEHNKPTCEAELWDYGFGNLDDWIAWYKRDDKWEILVAGPCAYERYGK